jgi:hypothetical protein
VRSSRRMVCVSSRPVVKIVGSICANRRFDGTASTVTRELTWRAGAILARRHRVPNANTSGDGNTLTYMS